MDGGDNIADGIVGTIMSAICGICMFQPMFYQYCYNLQFGIKYMTFVCKMYTVLSFNNKWLISIQIHFIMYMYAVFYFHISRYIKQSSAFESVFFMSRV